MARLLLACLNTLVFALVVLAQTTTIIDPAGNTIVELITIDPVAGLPTTEILQSLPPGGPPLIPPGAQSSSSSLTPPVVPPVQPTPTPSINTAPTTAPDVQQGPVGAPAPTTGPLGPIVYTYTTTDANGATIAVVDTFTATSVLSTPFTPPSTGSILDYSSWLQMVGTNTVGAVNTSGTSHLSISHHFLCAALAVVVGLAGGMRLVFA